MAKSKLQTHIEADAAVQTERESFVLVEGQDTVRLASSTKVLYIYGGKAEDIPLEAARLIGRWLEAHDK